MITDYDRIAFSQDHILMRSGHGNGWVAVNRHTHKEVSPSYSEPQGAIYFVVKLLQEQMGEEVEKMLQKDK